MPKVSVIIPAYNKAELTLRTVESVLGQTYPDIETIVIDDGSTDQTREALTKYADAITYIYQDNSGACSARNHGIRVSSGEYIAFLDCDDLYLPQKIEESVNYLESQPQCGFIHTDAYFINQKDDIIRRYSHPRAHSCGSIAKRLVLGNFICNSTVVAHRYCIQKTGFFDESIFTPADWDYWIRMAEIAPAGFIEEPLTKYRVTDNYIFNKLEQAETEEEKVIENFFARNRDMIFLKNKAFSNLHLRYAQCYLLKENNRRLREEYLYSLKENPFNWKAILMLFYYLFAQEHLKRNLNRRILRTN